MDVFTVIDDAIAIVRLPKGVLKQTKVYQRAGRVFVPHGGGFIRITAKFGDAYSTSHPDIKVVEFEAEGVDPGAAEPRYSARLKAAA